MPTRTTTFTQTLDTTTKTSDTFDPLDSGQAFGFSIGVTGTFVANWRVQRSLDAGSTWVDFVVLDQPDIVVIPTQAPALWRVSAAGAGDFTSGSAALTVQKGGHQAATPLVRLLNKDRTFVPASAAYAAAVTLTRTADTNAYAANDVIGAATGSTAALTFASMGPSAGGEVLLTSSTFKIDLAAVISGMTSYRLHLYNVTPPSALGDNAAWDLPAGDRASYLGYLDLGTPVDMGSTLYVKADQHAMQVTLASGSLFGYLVTIGAYTPSSADVHKITLHSAGF